MLHAGMHNFLHFYLGMVSKACGQKAHLLDSIYVHFLDLRSNKNQRKIFKPHEIEGRMFLNHCVHSFLDKRGNATRKTRTEVAGR